MLKRLTGWLLMLAILTANYSYLFVYTGFKLNQKYIASTLCENRNKPWLHCNGHCYLMKKLKQAEEKEKAEERESQKNMVQETFCEPCTTIEFHTVLLQTISTPYRASLPFLSGNTLFHPPQAA